MTTNATERARILYAIRDAEMFTLTEIARYTRIDPAALLETVIDMINDGTLNPDEMEAPDVDDDN